MKAPTEAFPLTWPAGWKRTEPHRRQRGKFHTTRYVSSDGGGGYSKKAELSVADAIERVGASIRRMGGRQLVISSNVGLRRDGMPLSGQKRPQDPGVAVYWNAKDGAARCIAVDQYEWLEHNLAAISGTLEALRAVERYGGAAILERAFTGFQALPPPMDLRSWRQVLGFEEAQAVGETMLRGAYMRARSAAHPDNGGEPGEFDAVQKAYDQAKRELGLP